MIQIRNEQKSDYQIVEDITREAFFLPKYQRIGYGKLLMEHSFKRAVELGYDTIVIFGSPANYVSRGFKSCKKYNLCVEGGGYPAGMLAKELKEGAFDGRKWTYSGSPVMDVDGQEAARFDDSLPPMAKEYRPSQDEFYIISQAFLG